MKTLIPLSLVHSALTWTILRGLNEFVVKFYGPQGTPYEGWLWKGRVDLPYKYPFKSPSIDLTNIFESFLPQLLTYPNPIDPLNGDAAAMYLHRPEEYKQKIKEYIQKYTTEEALKEQEEGTGDSSSESSMIIFLNKKTNNKKKRIRKKKLITHRYA
ncbi:Ubiquitin-conjugating enzyme E2 H [Lemmus lemmus]